VKLLLITVLITIATALLAQNRAYKPDEHWRAPESASTRHNPLSGYSNAVAGGRKLFLRNCAECHGNSGTGLEKKHSADLQLPVVQEQSDGVLFWKITNGNTARGMPAWSKLPELQRWQLVLYIRTLNNAAETSR
jgi:mono/diheme cytochrome c family protein